MAAVTRFSAHGITGAGLERRQWGCPVRIATYRERGAGYVSFYSSFLGCMELDERGEDDAPLVVIEYAAVGQAELVAVLGVVIEAGPYGVCIAYRRGRTIRIRPSDIYAVYLYADDFSREQAQAEDLAVMHQRHRAA